MWWICCRSSCSHFFRGWKIMKCRTFLSCQWMLSLTDGQKPRPQGDVSSTVSAAGHWPCNKLNLCRWHVASLSWSYHRTSTNRIYSILVKQNLNIFFFLRQKLYFIPFTFTSHIKTQHFSSLTNFIIFLFLFFHIKVCHLYAFCYSHKNVQNKKDPYKI